MNPALAINVLIIVSIIVCMVALQNPLALLALLVLQQPQSMLMPSYSAREEDDMEEETPMGFTADVR